MQSDAASRAVARSDDGHVTGPVGIGPQLLQRRCAPVTQQNAGTARQHRSQPLTAERNRGMPHRVDAAVQAMKPPLLDAAVNGAAREAQVDELPVRNHAVLASGHACDRSIGAWSTFVAPCGINVDHPARMGTGDARLNARE